MPIASAMPTGRALVLCVVSAVLYFLTFLYFDLYPLIWFAFVPVLLAIRGTTPGRALLLGTLFGAVTNAGGYYWVVHTIQTFGGLNIVLAVLGYLLLCIYQGFLLAIVIALVRYGQRNLGIAPVWSLAIVFPALELAYPLLFPSYIGNSQLQFHAITQFIDITGLAGLTLLIGLVNGALYEMLEARLEARNLHTARLAVPAVAVVACIAYGLVRLAQVDASIAGAHKLTVGLVQTNIGAQDKASDPDEFVARHRAMSRELIAAHPQVDLVVWPESAYNQLLRRGQPSVAAEVTQGIERPLLFGALTFGYQGDTRQIFNSLLLASEQGNVESVYDKIELLVFGETYPFSATLPALDKIFGTNWFTRGASLHHLQLDEYSLLPMICYEDILPSLVRRVWRKAGPASALVNGTNDSWYGDTHQPMIHLALASFRSIETRRALIRSTNTGISAIVDPAGRITHRTGQWVSDTLIAEVPLIEDGSSTVFMKIGDVTGWGCVALTLLGVWRARKAPLA